MTDPGGILEIARQLVDGNRAEQHGDFHELHIRTAALWNAYLGITIFDAHSVAVCMGLLKMARMKSGEYNGDDYVDLAGYAAIACALRNKGDSDE